MKIDVDEKTEDQIDRLITLLSLDYDASLSEVLAAAVKQIRDNDGAAYERDEAEARAASEGGRADRAERRLEEARPIIHASHGGQPALADLRLCVHPDCTRFL